MKIVIVGIGKFGKLLTEHLVKENHNVMIIDKNQSIIDSVVNECDCMGYVGNGASYQTLSDASVSSYDLLIAATPSDEVNILCCLVAKKIGIKQTIARVTNPDYSVQAQLMHNELGINETLNPDLDTANEIFRVLRYPNALKVETFANGKVDLVEIKLDSKSPLCKVSLAQMRQKFQTNILICAVKRDDDVIIPNGNFVLEEGDNVYLTGDTTEVARAFKKFDISRDKLKSAMIIGGSKVTYYLAPMLIDAGISVKVVDNIKANCDNMSVLIPNATILYGDGTNQSLLIEEGLENMDTILSLTGFDETNIIISTFAKSMSEGKVVTKVNNTNYELILNKLGLDSIVTPREIFTNNIIRYVRGMQGGENRSTEFKTLYRLVGNRVEALEFIVGKKTPYTSVPLKDLHIKKDYLLACIIRENKVIIPSGRDAIEPYDSVVIVTSKSNVNDVSDILE